MSVTNLMHTATDYPTEPQTAPVDPDAIWSNQCPPTCEFPNYKTDPCDAHAVNKPCSWKNCTSPSYATIQTVKGTRHFCQAHNDNYRRWQRNKVKTAPNHAHSWIVQSPNGFTESLAATCETCHALGFLDAYIDPAKFYVSTAQETARNSYQRDDDHDELGRLDACRDAAQALEDDFRSTGMDAYGHDYADPPHFDSEPNELLNQATLGYLPDTSDCQHHAAYQDRTTLLSHRPSAYAGLGSPAYDTDRPYLDHSQPDGFCPDCDTDLLEQDDYSPIARAALNEARYRIAAAATNAAHARATQRHHSNQANHYAELAYELNQNRLDKLDQTEHEAARYRAQLADLQAAIAESE